VAFAGPGARQKFAPAYLRLFESGELEVRAKRAVRIVARDDARQKAAAMFPALGDAHREQLEAYKVMDDADLFRFEWVEVGLGPQDLPGLPRLRVACAKCGEGINDGRERRVGAQVLCRSCAGEGYYKTVSG